ncbi:type VII secretion protein EssC [Alkalihalobacillus trypoxylicola]|uniref:Type VII secretion protein EssC n=1 Tax=Alkalihalobacillus trypoxylicola TaxID=519424 RepID=A0A161PW56_9BACI|nr:type VII secretion protein EssC [Alkalihalobacillus trypoxylicola]KYG26020.1 type VII secretion protein EssC [Alkalihalobacillus trypoxylicola]
MAMKLLIIHYKNQIHKCHLSLERLITIGNTWSNSLTFLELDRELTMNWDGSSLFYEKEEIVESFSLQISNDEMNIYLLNTDSTRILDLTRYSTVSLGPEAFNDIAIKGWNADLVIAQIDDNHFQLQVEAGNVFHNSLLIDEKADLKIGDQLFVDGVLMTLGEGWIEIVTLKNVQSKLVEMVYVEKKYDGEYPDYHRSPRIIYREPEEDRTIAKPSNKPGKPSEQLARTIVPPLVMIAAMVVISLVQPRGIFIIAMLAVTISTIIFSVTSYVKSVKKYKADMKERDVTYKEYLQRKKKELFLVTEEQRHSLQYHYPDVIQVKDMAVNVQERIYEKTMYHHDFLNFRAGIGEVDTSFKIDFRDEEFSQEKDELIDMARELLEKYKKVSNVPVVTSLNMGPVGYIGHRSLVLEQLQLLVMQLSLFHSYHDLQFITIFPEEEKNQWDWMRWLPHASMRDVNVRGFVYHERSRDQVLYSLYQIMKERKQAVDEKGQSKEKLYFTPHFVVLITDEKLILDHTIMEFFNEDPSEYGVSLIFVQDVLRALPEHVRTVIDIRDAKEGKIILEDSELVNKSFKPDHFPKDFDKELVSRALSPINHLQNLKNSIPEKVTFLELYGVERVEDLEVSRRWNVNETYKSLAVPLGLRGKEDLVQLNLHEKAHGPHGLVAGTTGSGKSEIIQSYILSLAVNFHPYEVAFLLIDYKGGGMANLFKNMPHLLGTITNLDKAQSMRALASIKAELQKRQRLFGEYDVNHINQYQKLFKQGKVSKPMPHLFLISDEFAELKAEQPDFMKELVSTARIGRSLGIHLILATQKPSGVVDDQIWSNSKFKLALKVQNSSDSNEILKTPDAAEITLPGRAYLQVGNNEIYELFQSAWSGADYIPDREVQDYVDTTIYAINDLGQYEILTQDLSGLDHKEQVEKVPTELDAVIDHIATYTVEHQIEPLERPWLPPLPEKICPTDIEDIDYLDAWQEPKKPLRATIGLVDQPEMQSQTPLTVDLSKDGHMAVYSSPGYGKSTFLQTVVLGLAKKHNPEHLHVFLLDFGTNGLLPLKDVPHVADTILVDETEKVEKFVRLLSSNMKERKQLLSSFGVANISMYERASGKTVPNICIVIDNYESVRDMDYVEEFERVITQVAREGASVGLHLVISSGRQNSMRMPLLSNIKTQIPLYLIEASEARSIIGKTDIEAEEIPGRGLIKLEDPALFQTILPEKGEESLEIIDSIRNLAKEMDDNWKGKKPEPIPMVPEVLDFNTFMEWEKTQEIVSRKEVSIAVEMVDVQPVAINLQKEAPLKVIADNEMKMKDTIENLIDSYIAQADTEVILIDNEQYNYSHYSSANCNYGVGKDYFEQIFDNINSWFTSRKAAVSELRKNNASNDDIQNLFAQMNSVVILITDYSILKNTLSRTVEEDFITILRQAKEYKIGVVFAGAIASFEGYDDLSKFLRDSGSTILFTELKNQNLYSVSNRVLSEKNLEQFEAYYIVNNMQTKIKTAKKGGEVYERV